MLYYRIMVNIFPFIVIMIIFLMLSLDLENIHSSKDINKNVILQNTHN